MCHILATFEDCHITLTLRPCRKRRALYPLNGFPIVTNKAAFEFAEDCDDFDGILEMTTKGGVPEPCSMVGCPTYAIKNPKFSKGKSTNEWPVGFRSANIAGIKKLWLNRAVVEDCDDKKKDKKKVRFLENCIIFEIEPPLEQPEKLGEPEKSNRWED